MTKGIHVRNIQIGNGIPKICVPIMGSCEETLIQEIKQLKRLPVEVVEWRVDYFQHVEDEQKVITTLSSLRYELGDTPLLFTFRSRKEGGQRDLGENAYFSLIKCVCETKWIDLVDIEWLYQKDKVRPFIEIAHKHSVKVILSNHDFEKTPSKEEMLSRLETAVQLGADIPKIAVMPTCIEDVLAVLEITATIKKRMPDIPIITISMGKLGLMSRLSGEIVGSALTFATAASASAPGQIPVEELKNTLHLIHNYS